jgi:transcriptional regulator GlxA family with amidase domain
MHGGVPAAHQVGFLLVPNFSMIAFTAAVEVLRLANHVSGREAFGWKVYSPDGKPVRASNGIEVGAIGAYADVAPLPEIVVCAGLGVERMDHTALIARLRKLASRGVSLGALCSAQYVLAKAGLLDGYRCAVHWENHAAFVEEFPQIAVTQELYEFDRNRFTCAGGTAAIDMMLVLVSARMGERVAAQVTDELIHHRMREAREGQRMALRARIGVAHPKMVEVVAAMEQHLEDPISCADLARLAKLSPRQLERLFKRYLRESPSRYYLGLRLDRARHLLKQTTMSILSVGLACGFVSASHFSKCYAEHFGRTPTEERRSREGGVKGLVAAPRAREIAETVIASEAKQSRSRGRAPWIASSLRSSQ